MQIRTLRQSWGQRPRGSGAAGDHDGVKRAPPGGADGAGAGMVWRGGGAGLTGGSIMDRTTSKRAETLSSERNLFCLFLLDISVCGASRVGGWTDTV